MRSAQTFLIIVMVFAARAAGAQDDSALFAAVSAKDTAAVQTVLDTGGDVNAVNSAGASALFVAVQQQSLDISRLLIEHGANINFVNEQNIGATALMMAVGNKAPAITALLLANDADVNLPDTNGDPAINWAAYYGYTEIAEQLLKAGASTEQVGHGNPRQIAMRRGHQPFVNLMARIADIRLPSPDTALLVEAIKAENLDALEDALALGASANATDFSGRPVLGLAARTGNMTVIRRLVAAGAITDTPDEIGFTPLMEAVRDGKLEVARYLLSQGADANHRSNASALFLAPMHMAGLSGSSEMVQLLADAGAAIDPKGREDGTPLMWALGEGKLEATFKLLELGANPTLKNSYGFSAADYAQQMQNTELLEKMGQISAP